MRKTSTQIALGGVFSALCLLLMFLTGLFPFATYALPMLAGAMLVAVVIENGRRAALMVYVSVSLLSLFIVPDRESALIFIAFFGWYPVVKEPLERLRSRLLGICVKFALFNASVVGGYFVAVALFRMSELLDGMEEFGRYAVLILLGAGNLLFLLYDYSLTKYVRLYVHWFKPRFLRR